MQTCISHNPTQEQFERAVQPHRANLLCTAMRFTGSVADAEDLVQETVMRAWRFWNRFDTGTNCQAWLRRILHNQFLNTVQRKKKEREKLHKFRYSTLVSRNSRSQEPFSDKTLSEEVWRRIESLPPEYRSVIMMVDMDERTYRETAMEMNCPVGTVMSRLHRARRILRKNLGPYARQQGYLQ